MRGMPAEIRGPFQESWRVLINKSKFLELRKKICAPLTVFQLQPERHIMQKRKQLNITPGKASTVNRQKTRCVAISNYWSAEPSPSRFGRGTTGCGVLHQTIPSRRGSKTDRFGAEIPSALDVVRRRRKPARAKSPEPLSLKCVEGENPPKG